MGGPMGGKAAKCITLLVLGAALAACTSAPNKEPDPNIFPAAHKQEILDTMTKLLDEPTNVRDAFISEPVLMTVNREQRYTVCVRSNARSGPREYEGSIDRIAYFYGGHLNQLVRATPEQCGKALYKPFPELEKLCLAKKCG